MMASLFGITGADLQAKLAPSSGSNQYSFRIAADGDLTEAGALAIIEDQEMMVEGYLRHRYQQLLRRVEGEVAVRSAREGQTSCALTLKPVTVVHGVYVNFPYARLWEDRRFDEALAEDEYEVNLSTGVVTFAEPLHEGDRVFVDYEHGAAAQLRDLRHLVLSLAAVEVARRFAYFRTADGFERFEGWQTSAAGHLRDLGRTDGAQIALFDRVPLVRETKNLPLGDL